MSDSDDLRSRIEAQIATRRRTGSGRHARAPAAPGHLADDHRTGVSRRHLRTTSEDDAVSPFAPTQLLDAVDAAPTSTDGHREEAAPRHRKRAPSRYGVAFRLLVLVTVAGVLALCLRTFIVEPFWIPSESMEPTLHGCSGCNDDRLLVDKLSYKLHPVHRGDVVVFHRPPRLTSAENVLIKRVVGLGGETVSAHDSRVWIGNRPLSEPYVNPPCNGTIDFAPVKVPKGDVFVMGDNRCDSSDSRVFGPIPTSSIIGRAFVIIWPLGRVHWL